jgi:hypothetical protein
MAKSSFTSSDPDVPAVEPADLTPADGGKTGPVSTSAQPPGPAVTMEELGIGPRDPYPEGGPAIPPAAGVPQNQAPPEEV